MTSLTEQFSSAGRAQMLAQLDVFQQLAAGALDNACRLVELQLEASRDTFVRSAEAWRQMLTARGPQEVFGFGSESQYSVERMMDMSRALFTSFVPAAPQVQAQAEPEPGAPEVHVSEPPAARTPFAEAAAEVVHAPEPALAAAPVEPEAPPMPHLDPEAAEAALKAAGRRGPPRK